MGDYKLVTVGTDGSASAERAVVRAAEICADGGARLLIVCAYETRERASSRDTAEAERALGDEAYKIIGSSPAEETLRDARDHAMRAGAQQVHLLARGQDHMHIGKRLPRFDEAAQPLEDGGHAGLIVSRKDGVASASDHAVFHHGFDPLA